MFVTLTKGVVLDVAIDTFATLKRSQYLELVKAMSSHRIVNKQWIFNQLLCLWHYIGVAASIDSTRSVTFRRYSLVGRRVYGRWSDLACLKYAKDMSVLK